MKRRTFKFKLDKKKIIVQQIFPSDFFTSTWPFSFYRTDEKSRKPLLVVETKKKTGEELKNEEMMINAVLAGLVKPKLTLGQVKELKAKYPKTFDAFLGAIYAVTYQVKDKESIQAIVSKEFLFNTYFLAKELGKTPWELVFGKSEGWNQKEYDFNLLCTAVGLQEKARLEEEAKNKYSVGK